MSTASTASGKGKKANGTTPFDQIVALEQQEKERVERELEAMEKERNTLTATLAEEVKEAEKDLREAAQKEVEQWQKEDMQQIVQAAEAEASKETEALKKQYEQKKDPLIKKLASSLLTIITGSQT